MAVSVSMLLEDAMLTKRDAGYLNGICDALTVLMEYASECQKAAFNAQDIGWPDVVSSCTVRASATNTCIDRLIHLPNMLRLCPRELADKHPICGCGKAGCVICDPFAEE